MAASLAARVRFTNALTLVSKLSAPTIPLQHARNLYGPSFLGLDKYMEQRERTQHQFVDAKDKFFQRIKQYFSGEGTGMVFTEDLKHVVCLCEDKEEDIDLVLKMLKRFNQQNKELRFGTFVFGPVVVRLFYHLQKPDIILKMLHDKDLDGFFDQFSSYQIAMDLLYKTERYQDLLNLFDAMQEKQLYGTKFPRECVVLALASCYKLNTQQSYEYAVKLVQDAREVGALVLRKGLTFAAALALNHNEPKVAMELLALTAQLNYITVRNLRMIALANMDRLDDVFLTLRSIIHQDVPALSRHEEQVCHETVAKVEESLKRIGDKEKSHMFEQMQRALRENNHLSEKSLEELLCAPMPSRPVSREFDRSSGPRIGSHTSAYQKVPIRGASGVRLPVRHRQGLRDVDD
ncbi:pentatricopeptide repeat-containing protein 2, mitochondrial-like [Ornithodoros turicata]|uniref:pentatricopeptide repeat-containing protein 2, mitochondrial-like n=1 Tax=Ornithodoros turicata TaxID=34597 RepID=UPI003139EF5F